MSRPFPATWRSPRPPLNKALPTAPVEVMTSTDFHYLARICAGGEEARELMRLCLYTLGYVEGLEVLDALDAGPSFIDEETALTTRAVEQARREETAALAEEMKTTVRPGVMAAEQDVMPASPAEPKKEGETQ